MVLHGKPHPNPPFWNCARKQPPSTVSSKEKPWRKYGYSVSGLCCGHTKLHRVMYVPSSRRTPASILALFLFVLCACLPLCLVALSARRVCDCCVFVGALSDNLRYLLLISATLVSRLGRRTKSEQDYFLFVFFAFCSFVGASEGGKG